MWYQSMLGIVVLIGLAWLLGENRGRPPWRVILVGLGLQFGVALAMLHLPPVAVFFQWLNQLVGQLQAATLAGTTFVFGFVGGGPAPYQTSAPANTFILGFQALPLILIMAALSALLYHWRILPRLVQGLSRFLELTMGVGGAVGVSLGANIFMGMVEAPLLIRPYLSRLSRSELFTLMTGGMATVSGTVMALYASFLRPVMPEAMGHVLMASLISAPAAVVAAQVMIPHTGQVTAGRLEGDAGYASAMDAVTRGAAEGTKVLISVAATLIVLVALVHLANAFIGLAPDVDGQPLSLQRLLGWLMAPICWLLGLPWQEALTGGELMGVKTVLNELIAYLELSKLPPEALSPRGRTIMVYALCGFANLGSLGILMGGLSALVPERRAEIAGLGFKSIISGTIATCLTGAVVGLLL